MKRFDNCVNLNLKHIRVTTAVMEGDVRGTTAVMDTDIRGTAAVMDSDIRATAAVIDTDIRRKAAVMDTDLKVGVEVKVEIVVEVGKGVVDVTFPNPGMNQVGGM